MAENQTTPPTTDYSGVREYKGARYVPVFASPAEWDNTNAYEPLTIVLYKGNSYTSTQYVPAGVGINDTNAAGANYWLQTGNYNAQVEAYRREVREYDERITDNTNSISEEISNRESADNAIRETIAQTTANLNSSIEENTNAIKENGDAIKENGDAIEVLKTQSKVIDDDAVVICIGDSIATGWSTEQPTASGWPQYLKTILNVSEGNIITEAVSGATFSSGFTSAFSSQLENAKTRVAQAGKTLADVKLIVIAGGVNDARNLATLSAIQTGCTALANNMTNFPNAMCHVFVGLMGNSGLSYNTMERYEWIAQCLNNANVKNMAVHTNTWTWMYDYNYRAANNFVSNDHIHLLPNGNQLVARYMVSEINGGHVYFDGLSQANTTIDGTTAPPVRRVGRMATMTVSGNYKTSGSPNYLLFTMPGNLRPAGPLGFLSNNTGDKFHIIFYRADNRAIGSADGFTGGQNIYGVMTWLVESPFG